MFQFGQMIIAIMLGHHCGLILFSVLASLVMCSVLYFITFRKLS